MSFTIPQLPSAQALDGTELLELSQNDSSVHTSLDDVAQYTLAQYVPTSDNTKQPIINRLTVAIAGDSITANNSSSSLLDVMSNHGYWTWANIFSGHRVEFPKTNNFGIGGNTSTQLLARINTVIAAQPGICLVGIGGNDYTAGISLATTKANLVAIWDALKAAGIYVIALPILPRGPAYGTYTTEHKAFVSQVNQFIFASARVRPNFEAVDYLPVCYDYVAMDGTAKAALQHDGTHPAQFGAFTVGAPISKVIERIAPPRTGDLFTNPSDVYSASNPYGNLVANGLLAGTTGTKSNGATGDVATNWALSMSSSSIGMTCVGSKEAHPTVTGLERQVITVGGTLTANGQAIFSQTINYNASSGYQPGDTVEAICEVEVVSSSNISGISLDIRNQDGASSLSYAVDGTTYGTAYTAAHVLPPVAWSGIFRTTKFVVPANPANIRPRVVITGWSGTTISAVVKIGRITFRRVPPV